MTLGLQWHSGQTLFRDSHHPVKLGAHIADGNQGIFFELEDDERFIAKLYARERTNLDVLVGACRTRGLVRPLTSNVITAAPMWVLCASQMGPTIGCIMPKLDLTQFDDLDTYHRVAARDSSLSERLQIARVIAAAVTDYHKLGFMVGDLKPQNILIHDDLLPVAFIDVDSFTVVDDNGDYEYAYSVSTERYRAPELRIGSLATLSSDEFALGLIVLQTLYEGVHPFARPRRDDVENDIQGRIDARQSWLLAPKDYFVPPNSPAISALPATLQRYSRSCLTGTERPSAEDWLDALGATRVEPCAADGSHERFVGCACLHCAHGMTATAPADVSIDLSASTGPPAGPANERQRRSPLVAAAWVLLVLAVLAVVGILAAKRNDSPESEVEQFNALVATLRSGDCVNFFGGDDAIPSSYAKMECTDARVVQMVASLVPQDGTCSDVHTTLERTDGKVCLVRTFPVGQCLKAGEAHKTVYSQEIVNCETGPRPAVKIVRTVDNVASQSAGQASCENAASDGWMYIEKLRVVVCMVRL